MRRLEWLGLFLVALGVISILSSAVASGVTLTACGFFVLAVTIDHADHL